MEGECSGATGKLIIGSNPPAEKTREHLINHGSCRVRVFSSQLLSSPYVSGSLRFVTQIKHWVTWRAILASPCYGARLRFYREKSFAFSSLVDSRRIVHTHAATVGAICYSIFAPEIRHAQWHRPIHPLAQRSLSTEQGHRNMSE